MEQITRDSLLEDILTIDNKTLILEYSTGTGKSKLALEWMDKYDPKSILLVVPKLVLINNFREEVIKWGKSKYLNRITNTTYVSLPKYANTHYDCIILDECHHLTDRAKLGLEKISFNRMVGLSATIPSSLEGYFRYKFNANIQCLKLKRAIENEILPNPKLILLPMRLDNTKANLIYTKRASKPTIQYCTYQQRWTYLKKSNLQVKIQCTAQRYYEMICGDLQYAITHNMSSFESRIRMARPIWLASQKDSYIKTILNFIKNERVLIFCSSIEQSNNLCKYSINSKEEHSLDNLEAFNRGEINHISSVSILNEGCNITNCKIGLFVHIQASNISTYQKLGRCLRHDKPIVIMPYYEGTWEEDIVNNKIIPIFDEDNIVKVNYINDLKTYLK